MAAPHERHLLLVSSDRATVNLLKEGAARLPLVHWHFVDDILQARAFLHRKQPYPAAPHPHLALLDLHAPAYPGHSFIAKIKNDPLLSDILVVAIPPAIDAGVRLLFTEMGADAIIARPRSLAQWEDALAPLLARAAGMNRDERSP